MHGAESVLHHRVAFYETDAMGVVHHANYLHFMERARVHWMEEHHRPYTEYVAEGLQFAVIRVDAEYLKPARFDERIEVHVRLCWVRAASLCMGYEMYRATDLLLRGTTEHAVIDERGRVRRLPRERRTQLEALSLRRPEL